MFEFDQIKITLMAEHANYQYNVIPFRLNNVGATYHRIMNKYIQKEIEEILEVYMET